MSGWGDKNDGDYEIASSDGRKAKTLGSRSVSLRKEDGTEFEPSGPSEGSFFENKPSADYEDTKILGRHQQINYQTNPLLNLVGYGGTFLIGLAFGYFMFEGPDENLKMRIDMVCGSKQIISTQTQSMEALCGDNVQWNVIE